MILSLRWKSKGVNKGSKGFDLLPVHQVKLSIRFHSLWCLHEETLSITDGLPVCDKKKFAESAGWLRVTVACHVCCCIRPCYDLNITLSNLLIKVKVNYGHRLRIPSLIELIIGFNTMDGTVQDLVPKW
ncbi:hypothetical protein PNOK_0720100 [Pyrrhoderma noxium]|uniref:Uncharacterized protein n=1 Tax=Pyrrhoderma noxium TaxID=2282107 RepID=A0A286UC52_9AGAM|nr:hypothetical protein PNOK_0720100 [Pyrrhoderma noxium]